MSNFYIHGNLTWYDYLHQLLSSNSLKIDR